MSPELLRHRYERWILSTQSLSPHTVRAYSSDVHSLLRFLGPEFRIETLVSDDLYRFVDHLSAKEASSVTIRRRVSGIRSFCCWLSDSGIVESDPAEGLSLRFAQPKRLPRVISAGELSRLLRHLTLQAGLGRGLVGSSIPVGRQVEITTLLATLLLVGTGMRVGELTGVTLAEVDLESRTIRVLGKGLRERMVYLSNDWVVSLLQAYLLPRETVANDEALLLNRSGHPLSSCALRARLERAGMESGLGRRLTPHMLRHTAATQLIEAGVDIRFVQRLLGHASLMTTEIYTHVADRSLRNAVIEADVIGRFVTVR